jgi:hypothetical protein
MTASQLAPIRKIAVTFLAGALIYIAARLGLQLDDQQAQEAAQWVVPVLLGYLTPDPKVVTAPPVT